MHVDVLPARMSLYHSVWCPRKPEEGVRSVGFELKTVVSPQVGAGNYPCPATGLLCELLRPWKDLKLLTSFPSADGRRLSDAEILKALSVIVISSFNF